MSKKTLMYQANYYTLTFMIRKAQQKKSGETPIFGLKPKTRCMNFEKSVKFVA